MGGVKVGVNVLLPNAEVLPGGMNIVLVVIHDRRKLEDGGS